MSHRDTTEQVGDALDRTLGAAIEHATGHVPDAVRPRLRGWLHAAAAPVALVCGIVLVALSRGGPEIAASAVYAFTTTALFAVSAAYHRGRWTPRTHGVLKRVDHANIFLIIAGTYTPFTVVLLDGGARTALLWLVWALALIGVAFRVLWVGAPRWLYVPAYVAFGWVAVFFLPEFAVAGGIAVIVPVIVGGLLYTLGGVVYALKRPDPHPGWFGFHEVFHALTLLAYVLQYIAVMITVVAH
ncbi:MAG: hemolysin III family protein [Candidatus Nanopelagicales bacterium]